MYVTALLAIWVFGLLILFTDPTRTSTRWASATALIGGLGFFSEVIEQLFYMNNTYFAQHPILNTCVLILIISASFLCQTGLPYAFLMFAIHSSDFLSRRIQTRIQYAALLPLLAMLLVSPIYPALKFNYWLMISWVIPYFLCSCTLLIYLYRTEKDPLLKRSRLLNNILMILPLSLVFTFLYIMRLFDNYEAWRYNTLVVGIQSILFVIISVKYGLLGVRLKLEKRRMDSTFRAMTSGTSIINHTIKNELGKITLFADRIQSYADESKQAEMREDMQILLQSTQNILAMVNRIQGQIQDIVLKESVVSLSEIIDRVAHDLKPYTERYQINLTSNLSDSFMLRCDPVHIREVLTNLCMNSMEAMKSGGSITLSAYPSRKQLILSVADNGSGIAKENLPYVLDPFFSTKKQQGKNFGLGLTYCYNVMQKHQGSLEIHSVKNEGTTVYLFFPMKRLIIE
ncbi:sensor histidine kinase [Brevibacillus ginsengisoli]|uniref:sensor histidine kinase n=1 Tax=Brevibacillus ginsengisoli TaxID=363854 RepID=UPI003CF9D7A4